MTGISIRFAALPPVQLAGSQFRKTAKIRTISGAITKTGTDMPIIATPVTSRSTMVFFRSAATIPALTPDQQGERHGQCAESHRQRQRATNQFGNSVITIAIGRAQVTTQQALQIS